MVHERILSHWIKNKHLVLYWSMIVRANVREWEIEVETKRTGQPILPMAIVIFIFVEAWMRFLLRMSAVIALGAI